MSRPQTPPSDKAKKPPRRPYEEISAMFNGNEVKIRVPKSTNKPQKLTPSQLRLQQNCTCEDDEDACSDYCGMPEPGTGGGNRLDFQIPDDLCESYNTRTVQNSEMVYAKTDGRNLLCNLCNVTPSNAPKGVKAQKVLHPDKDVFLLKIGKQTDEPNRTGNIEVELVTPRAPAKFKPPSHNCVQIQCEENEIPCCMPFKPCKRRTRRRCCL